MTLHLAGVDAPSIRFISFTANSACNPFDVASIEKAAAAVALLNSGIVNGLVVDGDAALRMDEMAE